MQYIIELSDVEQKAMEYIAVDVNEWIQNAVHNRARVAIEEMVSTYISEVMTAGGTISGTKEEIAMNSNLPNAKERNDLATKMMTGMNR